MPSNRARLLVGITLILTACEEVPTRVERPSEPVADLALAAPEVAPTDLARVTVSEVGDPAAGAALLSEPEEGGEPAMVFNARTRVGFWPGEAYAIGSHDFYGHAGRVETSAHVTWEDGHLGSQTAVNERSYWLSTQITKHISVAARVRSEHTCGLTVQGSSVHSAWWELFQLRSAPRWGYDYKSTTGGPLAQGACGKKVANTDPTGEYTTAGGIVCTYLITYDMDTLVVVDIELLYCQTTHGELL